MAEDRPARPPPMTRTLCEGITLPPARLADGQTCREEILNFFGARQRDASREHVEIALFHPCENSAVGSHQRPESRPAVGVDVPNQRGALCIQTPRAIRFEFEQLLQRFRGWAAKIDRGTSES